MDKIIALVRNSRHLTTLNFPLKGKTLSDKKTPEEVKNISFKSKNVKIVLH